MENVEMTVKGDILTVKVDLTKRLGKSASGKSDKIASTGGNVSIPEHPAIKIGMNVYIK